MSVRVEATGLVTVITIDRPECRNAIDGATAKAIDLALREAEADPTVGAVVLTGSGNRAFCSGVDLREFSERTPAVAVQDVLLEGGFCGLTARFYSKPIVAAVNGAAIAGGWELVLACDLIVASETAYFRSNEVTRGMIADAGGCLRLPRVVGQFKAREFLLLGDPVSARAAETMGLANFVVAPDQLLDAAIALANRVLQHAPTAVWATRKLVFESANLSDPEAWEVNQKYADATVPTQDALEGSTAFVTKRRAEWSGR